MLKNANTQVTLKFSFTFPKDTQLIVCFQIFFYVFT